MFSRDGGNFMKNVARLERIGYHSHIRGLGLEQGSFEAGKCQHGMVGQAKARKAAGLVVEMIKNSGIAGRGILLAGPPGTGKTALSFAINKTLGEDLPFNSVNSSEFFGSSSSKAELLIQNVRKSVALKKCRIANVFRGQVARLDLVESDSSTKKCNLTLKTMDMDATYEIGEKLFSEFEQKQIEVNDVIEINKESGKVRKIGRSNICFSEHDLHGAHVNFVPCPTGEIEQESAIDEILTLHEMDLLTMSGKSFGLFSEPLEEISTEVRKDVDRNVSSSVETGNGKLLKGVLFIDEAHILDIESFGLLNRLIEDPTSPLIILATNRGFSNVRGTRELSPHGMPTDFLDRLLIIRMEKYTKPEYEKILRIRLDEEDVRGDEEFIAQLSEIALETSLRYAIQLISICEIIRRQEPEKQLKISIFHLERAYELFIDVKRSQESVPLNTNNTYMY